MSKCNPLSPPALTRRGFLEQLGAVGGSSLVFSAMTSWDLMAGAAGQKPELTGTPAKSKVLVLGGGLSGMVVGYELGKLGYDYQVLEARDRVGGLQWAVKRGTEHTEVGGERQVCTFDEGQYINVGPWRIPYSHEAVLNYCRELNVPRAGVPQRIGRQLSSTSRASRRRPAVQQEDPGARDQGRRHRADQRAAREGDRSEEARSAVDRGRSKAHHQLPHRPGLSRSTTRAATARSRIAAKAIRISWRICCAARSRSACVRCRRSKARPRRRCSSRSAAWIRSPRASSARWIRSASRSTPKCRRCFRATPA